MPAGEENHGSGSFGVLATVERIIGDDDEDMRKELFGDESDDDESQKIGTCTRVSRARPASHRSPS